MYNNRYADILSFPTILSLFLIVLLNITIRAEGVSGVICDTRYPKDLVYTHFTLDGSTSHSKVPVQCWSEFPITTIAAIGYSESLCMVKYNIVDKQSFAGTVQVPTSKCSSLLQLPYTDSLAGLSNSGSYLAFLQETRPLDRSLGGTPISAGLLKLHEFEGSKIKQIDTALETNLAWHPEAEVLYYNTFASYDIGTGSLVDRHKAHSAIEGKQPIIVANDLDNGSSTVVCTGYAPHVSADGKYLWYYSTADELVRLSLDSKTSNSVKLPGGTRQLIGALNNSWIVTWGDSVKKTPRMTKNNSPLIGPKPMVSIRLVNCNTQDFQVLIEEIDPRAQVAVKWEKPKNDLDAP